MAARGARRLLVGAVVESAAERARYAAAIPGAEVSVCLLTASQRRIERRLGHREVGSALGWHLERSRELEAVLVRAGVEDFVVSNDDEPVERVARGILARAGWLAD